MRNFSDMYVVQDDYLWISHFEIKGLMNYHLNDKVFLDKLKAKLFNFHIDYIDLSQQYKLGEILPLPFLRRKNINLKKEYGNFLKKKYEQNEYISFFPYWHNNHLNFKVNYPCSSNLTLFINTTEITDYTFSLNALDVELLSDMNFDEPVSFESDIMQITQDNLSLTSKKSYEPFSLYFSMEIFSDFWYEGVSRSDRLRGKNGTEPYLDENADNILDLEVNNRYIAYRNTPRFNSFLRDLKILFVDKYGWSYNSDYEDIRRDGIPLDGKIIYQEDIDEGRVQLPDIETFGQVVEAGKYL